MISKNPQSDDAARDTDQPAVRIDLESEDLAGLARALLGELGKAAHPDAESNPVYALFQVAVDFRCSAEGYRDLYVAQRKKLTRLIPQEAASPQDEVSLPTEPRTPSDSEPAATSKILPGGGGSLASR